MKIEIGGVYWLFAVVYSFMVWGFWWGVLSMFIPIFPIIDLVKWMMIYLPIK